MPKEQDDYVEALEHRLRRLRDWLLDLAKANDAALASCRFQSLAEAYRADAENGRATAASISRTLALRPKEKEVTNG